MKTILPVRSLLVAGLALGLGAASSAQTTRIHVVLDGVDAPGTDVYVDGRHRGRTDGQGILDVDRTLLADGVTVLSARQQVYEVPAFLPGHEDARSPRGWIMRAYVTSVTIDNSGNVKLFRVTDRTAVQELVLKRDNVLIGLQLLASVDWDMSEADFTRLMQTFQVASRYLWNATDGQFVFETVKIADQARNWDRSMFRLYADNTPRPRATAGGYLGQNSLGASVGSYVTIPWRDSAIHLQGPRGPWSGADPRTFVHEFGHLGFELGDEYSDVAGETCTVRRDSDPAGSAFRAGGEKAACVMDSQFNSSKFCSDQGPNSHNYTTLQVDDCWAEIRGHFSDPHGARYVLKTPVTRGALVGTLRGPSGKPDDAIPVEWNTGFVVTNTGWSTELCPPFLQLVIFADGTPADRATVKLLYTSIDPSQRTWISQGKTFASGQIAILGAHVGDTVMTQTAFPPVATCSTSPWPPGALGVLDADRDSDRVPDAFDTCPSLFNPYLFDPTTGWVAQSGSCSCATVADCGAGLFCAVTAGTGRCVVPACRNDDDCGAGRSCQGGGAAAACAPMAGTRCTGNDQCPAGRCDVGDGSSRTGLCVPNPFAGPFGAICSHDNQCVSANCAGLRPDGAGGWRPGRCAAATVKPLGAYCFNHSQCASGYCDAGDGTSKTNLCMPNRDGRTGDMCSHDHQCTSGNCGGLAPAAAGGWQPGRCSANDRKPLGDYCFAHSQCESAYCDGGDGTSKTNRCMPNRDGQPGQVCSHDNQCASLNCSGLANLASAVPGTCAAKRALGVSCTAHHQCASAFCDAGWETSNTYLCMPNRDGRDGDKCTHDKQCASLNCAGLAKDNAGHWVPGACAAKRALRASCTAHNQCNSAYCDAGDGTSRTNLCMPNGNGRVGDDCSHDNQCSSSVCAGLTRDGAGNWVPGLCASKRALGDACALHYQCASGYCDSGWNTSKTDRCMPNTNGRTGDICSHHNQCSSRVCNNLRAQGNAWIPGTCR